MAFLAGPATLSEMDLYQTSTTAPSGIGMGQLVAGPQGKYFRMGLVGGSALVTGNVLQSPAIDTQFNDMAVPAAVAAATPAGNPVVITNGTTAVAAGDFIGATAVISVTPGLGEEYTVLDHSTAGSGAALTLYLDRPIRTAWTTSTKVTLRKSPYRGMIQMPATLTGITVGGALSAAAASTYTFIQVGGIGSLLSDNSTFAIGSALSNSVATAGCVGVFVAGTARSFIGHAYQAASSGKCIPVDMKFA